MMTEVWLNSVDEQMDTSLLMIGSKHAGICEKEGNVYTVLWLDTV